MQRTRCGAAWAAVVLVACGEGTGPSHDRGDTDAGGNLTARHGCADLYDQALLPTFEIEMEEGALAALLADATTIEQPYHPLSELRYGEEVFWGAEIRVHGNAHPAGKVQFQISFNENDPDGRFHGLRKLVLDAPSYDLSLLRNRLAASILFDLGLPVSCTNNARLVVNGEYYGVYANIERVDREFLERAYGGEFADGNLYQDGRELRTNEKDADPSRMERFWSSAGDFAALDELGEVDQWIALWASDALLPHGDGICCVKNFYLYDHPTRGFVFIGWDYDLAFDAWIRPDVPTVSPQEDPPIGIDPTVRTVLDDEARLARWTARIADALHVYNPHTLHPRIDAWSAQIADAVAEDESISPTDHATAVASLREYVSERSAWLETWVACMADGDCG